MRYRASEKVEIIRIVEQSSQSPRELAVRFTDERGYFVSEATVYRLLKAHDLITSPAFIVIKAASEFTDKTTRPNEMGQTDFTYFKIIGSGWMYLSTILDDYSRYIIAWKLCSAMRAEDVTDTLDMALAASGCDQTHVHHKSMSGTSPRPAQVATAQRQWLQLHIRRSGRMARRSQNETCARSTLSSADPGQDRGVHRAL